MTKRLTTNKWRKVRNKNAWIISSFDKPTYKRQVAIYNMPAPRRYYKRGGVRDKYYVMMEIVMPDGRLGKTIKSISIPDIQSAKNLAKGWMVEYTEKARYRRS